MRRVSNSKRMLRVCFVCFWVGLLADFVVVTPVLADSLSLDQTFGPGWTGDWYPLATIDPGDTLIGTLTVIGSGNTSAGATAEIDFTGKATTIAQAFTLPNADTMTLTVNFSSSVGPLQPTLTNVSGGSTFVSAGSTYPDGAYYPRGTAAPVFGIASLPDFFHSARVTFTGQLMRANPAGTPGAAFEAANSQAPTPPDLFPTHGPPTVQQLAALAQDAFNASHQTTASYEPVRTINGDYGFSATVYKSTDGSQLVIAARGTSSASDRIAAYNTLADGSFLAGTPTVPLVEEAKQLADVVRQVANDIKPDGPLYTPVAGEAGFTGPQVSLTGYSLGGALSQIVAAGANVQSVTFLSPGARQLDLHLDVPQVNSLAALGIDSPSHGIWDYRQWGDLVSLAGTQLGTTITSDNPKLLPIEETPLGAPTLAADVAFAWGTYHSLDLLRGTLASAPTLPGQLGPQQQLGAPDAGLLQTLILAPVGTVTTLFVPNIQAATLKLYDPQPGYGYSLLVDPTSPDITTIRLPVGGDIAGWIATFSTGGGAPVTLSSLTGEFTFGTGVDHIDFRPLDRTGLPTLYPDPFFFGLAVDRDGTFKATLTALAAVPEPSTFVSATLSLIGPYLIRRRKTYWRA
jgi:hypothetical protein